MANSRVILEHKGDLDFDLIGKFLSQLNQVMNEMGMEINSKKILYSVMVECLENIYRHFDLDDDTYPSMDEAYKTAFSLKQHDENTFKLEAGNLILNENVKKLKNKLKMVNSLDKQGLKELYKITIKGIVKSNTNSAGLGIIDIAKLSGNKIGFSFQKINEEFSYFRILITISNIIHYKKATVL